MRILAFSDLQRDGTHEGSRAIRDAVRATQPRLHLCGHIHNAWGMTDRVGGTPVHNLGPELSWFDVRAATGGVSRSPRS